MDELTLFGQRDRDDRPDWLANPRVLRWETAGFDGVEVLKAIVECPDHPSGEAALTEAVATAMVAGYTKPRDALARVADRHKTRINVQNSGRYPGRGRPDLLFVTREGVNRLVLDSAKPEAARLKDWLAEDVMPAIEDTGSYAVPTPLTEVDLLDQLEAEARRTMRAIAGWRQEKKRAELAEARADVAEGELRKMRAAGGLTLRVFRKTYFPDVKENEFLAHCYRKNYLIDQRPCDENGDRLRDDDNELVYGKQHRHPGHAGLRWLKLEGKGVHGGKRRADTRVRPHTETDFVDRLVQDGLPRYDQLQIGQAS